MASSTVASEQDDDLLRDNSASPSSPSLAELPPVVAITGSPPRPSPRAVVFGRVEVREYARTLGDHPDAATGPPLALDWEYEERGSLTLEEYEQQRQHRRGGGGRGRGGKDPSCKRRYGHPSTVVSRARRERILLSQTTVTIEDIRQTEGRTRADRHKRIHTYALQEVEHVHLFCEFVARRIQRLVRGVSKEREQELLWEGAASFHERTSRRSGTDEDGGEGLNNCACLPGSVGSFGVHKPHHP
jgi:hypothetical protein